MPGASDEDCNRMGFAETGLGESWNCVAGAVTMWTGSVLEPGVVRWLALSWT